MDTGYSFWKGVRKSLLSVLIIGLPVAMQVLPEAWMNMTIGGLLAIVVNFLKFQYNASQINR